MKKLSLLLVLFILATMLCAPAGTSPQTEQTETKAANQPQMPNIAPVELTGELTQLKLSDSEIEPTTPPREAPAEEAFVTVHFEPDEHSAASTVQAQPITEFKPSDAPVKETAPASTQSGSGLPGFDYVPYLGPNVVIYVEDMYENGNKIGIMGDINKQVGIMD